MDSLILRVGGWLVLPVSLAVSVYLLWRGHNDPGGGFVGGLMAAAGLAFYALPRGADSLHKMLMIPLPTIAGIGLLCALLSGVPAIWTEAPYLTHQWGELPNGFAIGTPLLFDIGVYLAVIGAVLTFLSHYLEA